MNFGVGAGDFVALQTATAPDQASSGSSPSKLSTGKPPVRLSYLLDTLLPEEGLLNAAQKEDDEKFFYLVDRGADSKRVSELYRNQVLQMATRAGRGDFILPFLKNKSDVDTFYHL